MTTNPNNPFGDNTLSPLDDAEGEPAGNDPGTSAAAALRLDMLGGGEVDGQDMRKPKISYQNGLLLLVVVGAASSLVAMRYIGMGPRSSIADAVKIDYDVAKPVTNATTEHLRVLADLSTAHAAQQVPPDQVQRNPFKMAGTLAPESQAVGGPDNSAADRAAKAEAERKRREAEQRQQDIDSTLASLQINSVMEGAVPLARISGRTVRIGDRINDLFTVTDIHGRGVVLECDGKVYNLEIPEGQGRNGGALPPTRRNPANQNRK